MFERHKLVWLSEQGWQAALNSAPQHLRGAINHWRQADWPAVVRRADENAAVDEVCLGIALPPDKADGSKTRIPLRVAISNVKKVLDPLQIGAVAASAPQEWYAHLNALAADAERFSLSVRVYGSAALQALTGQQYVTAASDIDLLFYPETAAQLQTGIDLLVSHARVLPLDGEIVFPSGQAVAWKEWLGAMHAASACRVLVKEKDAVHLSTMEMLLRTLEEYTCPL